MGISITYKREPSITKFETKVWYLRSKSQLLTIYGDVKHIITYYYSWQVSISCLDDLHWNVSVCKLINKL